MSETKGFWSKPLISGAEGITARALVIGLGITIFDLWFSTYTSLKLGLGFTTPLIVYFLIEFLLGKLVSKKWQLTVPEWVSFVTIASATSAVMIFFLTPPIFGPIKYPELAQYAPAIWTPDLSALVAPGVTVLDAFEKGGVFSLSAWITPLLYWSIAVIAYYMMGFFLLLPLRKTWIDQERLPFPSSTATYELVKFAKAQDRPSLWSMKRGAGLYLAIGILVGLLLQSYQLIQWFGGTAIWAGSIDLDLTPILGNLFPNVNWAMIIYLSDIPVWLFAPLEILATSILGWVVVAVAIPYLLVTTGIDPVFAGPRNYGLYFGAFRWQLMFTEWYAYGGIILGVVLWVAIQNWRRYTEVIRSALKGGVDPTEGISWRTGLIVFVLSFLTYVGLVVTAGASVIGAILSTVFLLLVVVYFARYFGELSTTPPGNVSNGGYLLKGTGQMLGLFPATGYNQDLYVSMLNFQTFGWSGGQNPNSMAGYSLNSYKVGNMTKTDNKTVLISTAIMVVVSIFLVGPFFLWVLQGVGGFDIAKSMYWGLNYSGDFFGLGGFPNYISRTIVTGSLESRYALDGLGVSAWILSGSVVVLGMFWLRTIFPWFWLNPLGLAMIVRFDTIASILVALVVKGVTLRFGGAKAYEEVLVPLAVGTLVGMGLMGFIAGVVLPLTTAI
jgi:hypothetical protein